jgi:redox-sensing transcriptional repressor
MLHFETKIKERQAMPLKLSNRIPDIVIGRLPLYLRALTRLQQEGRDVTSSHELGRRLGISSAQIRKDLSHFGGFGKQGTGYQIEFLVDKLRQVLQVNQQWAVAVVGAGNLGSAISHYDGFTERGFRISWLFDADPGKVGNQIGKFKVLPITDMEQVIKENNCQIAMLAVPAEYAQDVADKLVQAGVRAILNYAPISINVPENVMVQYIDPVVHMQHMTYYLRDDE